MVQYIETFCLSGGVFLNLEYHRARVLRTVGDAGVWVAMVRALDGVDGSGVAGRVRVTVGYSAAGVSFVRAAEYVQWNPVRLVPVVSDIDYGLKYADRSGLEALRVGVGGDEEPLIVRDGLVTDVTFANVVFRDSGGGLFTPRRPLLEGTKRARLIDEGVIVPCDIGVGDLAAFDGFYLINAMRDL